MVSHRRVNSATALTICGPSGAGKSTVARTLARTYPAFIETTEGNPHLKGLLEGKVNFDAAANQGWFLERISEHITHADSCFPLVLDQDPAAIVLAYSRMFRDESKINDRDYNRLVENLIDIEVELQRWSSPREVLVLDAPPEVLRARVLQQSGPSRTLPIEWFVKVRTCFQEFSKRLPKKTTLSTVDLSPGQVIAQARQILENALRSV